MSRQAAALCCAQPPRSGSRRGDAVGAEPRDAADAPVRPGCWLACDNRPGRAAHMVTAVHGGRVWFGDREPLHVGFLPWWRVVDPPNGKGGK